jgi:hypothetical protein
VQSPHSSAPLKLFGSSSSWKPSMTLRSVGLAWKHSSGISCSGGDWPGFRVEDLACVKAAWLAMRFVRKDESPRWKFSRRAGLAAVVEHHLGLVSRDVAERRHGGVGGDVVIVELLIVLLSARSAVVAGVTTATATATTVGAARGVQAQSLGVLRRSSLWSRYRHGATEAAVRPLPMTERTRRTRRVSGGTLRPPPGWRQVL